MIKSFKYRDLGEGNDFSKFIGNISQNYFLFNSSCGPGLSDAVSRKAILDKSLNCPLGGEGNMFEEEDIWFSTSKLFLVRNVITVINNIHARYICRIISMRYTANGRP